METQQPHVKTVRDQLYMEKTHSVKTGQSEKKFHYHPIQAVFILYIYLHVLQIEHILTV